MNISADAETSSPSPIVIMAKAVARCLVTSQPKT